MLESSAQMVDQLACKCVDRPQNTARLSVSVAERARIVLRMTNYTFGQALSSRTAFSSPGLLLRASHSNRQPATPRSQVPCSYVKRLKVADC